MNNFFLSISNPWIRAHVRSSLTHGVAALISYTIACVANQTPAIQHFIIGVLSFAQSFIPAIAGIVTNGQINTGVLSTVIYLALAVTILPALLRIPWIQKNQLAAEIITDAEEVAAQAPALPVAAPEAVLPMPAAAEAQKNVQEPLKQP